MAAITVVLTLPARATAQAVEVAPGVAWTQIVREQGPVRINVLEVDPALVHGVLSNNRVAGRERVSGMARRAGAAAGVNGTYFGPSGDPVGVLAMDGTLLSEPVDGRSALVLGPGGAAVGAIRFSGSVSINGVERLIDGVERTRGLIPACGGRGGDVPTARPNAVLTCTDASELVLLSPKYGARPPREGGVEAVLRDGTVARVRAPGTGPVPRDGLLLTGTGDAARFLRDVALPRSRAEIQLTLTSAGRQLELAQQTLVVGAGPRLLRGGRVAVAARAEGFAPPQAPAFYGTFVAARQPRTLAGVRADGKLLLVTVDGRRPGWSAGMTLPEAARLMRSLGAREAVNLDGGGSTTMTVRGEVVNRPSDPGGERPVSNGVFAIP
jgi:hypothetical protein